MEIQWQPKKKNQIIERFELAKVSRMAENNSYSINTERERERERERDFCIKIFFYYASLTHTLQNTLFIYNWIDKTRKF